jgi:hypothetical protein
MTISITATYTDPAPGRPATVEVLIDDDSVAHIAAGEVSDVSDLVCDVVNHLGAPGITRTATGEVEIVEYADRAVAIRVNGKEVGRTDYDESGWAGLSLLRNVARNVADASGLTVATIDGDDEDDNEDPEG